MPCGVWLAASASSSVGDGRQPGRGHPCQGRTCAACLRCSRRHIGSRWGSNSFFQFFHSVTVYRAIILHFSISSHSVFVKQLQTWNVSVCSVHGSVGSGGLQGRPLSEEARDCPVLDMVISSQLQWTHCRTQLSPSAKLVVPLGNVFKKGQDAAQWREEREKEVWQTSLQTPRSVKKEGMKVLKAPEQRFLCSPWWRPWWSRLCPAAHGEPRQSR